MLRDQIERYNQRLRDFEDKQRVYRSHQQLDRPGDTDIEVSLVSTFFSFKCLFIEVLQGYSAPYSATSIYISWDFNKSYSKRLQHGQNLREHINMCIFGLHADNISAVFSLENLLQVLPIQIWPHLILNFCAKAVFSNWFCYCIF